MDKNTDKILVPVGTLSNEEITIILKLWELNFSQDVYEEAIKLGVNDKHFKEII